MKYAENLKDEDLIRLLESRVKAEEDRALQVIYEQVFPTIKKFIVQNSGGEQDARDVFQDTMLIFYHQVRSGKFRKQSSLSTYIFTIARRLWLKVSEKQKRYQRISTIVEDGAMEMSSVEAEGLSSAVVVHKLLAQISENCQKILRLYYFEQRNMEEIREIFGLGSVQSAKTKKYRCLQQMITLFNKHKISKDLISGSND